VSTALQRLVRERQVRIDPKTLAVTGRVTRDQAREMRIMLQVLESYAAGLAAETRTPCDLAELYRHTATLQSLTTRMRHKRVQYHEVRDLHTEDRWFHLRIVAITRNALLLDQVIRLSLLRYLSAAVFADSPVHASQWEQTGAEHGEIVAEISRGNAAAAQAAMDRHHEVRPPPAMESAFHRPILDLPVELSNDASSH
jgi:DNA-binding GntR family transcriptional regulator